MTEVANDVSYANAIIAAVNAAAATAGFSNAVTSTTAEVLAGIAAPETVSISLPGGGGSAPAPAPSPPGATGGGALNCIAETCHNDGHWVEVAFPEVNDINGCISECLLHPEATALQYNDDGWCGCMVMDNAHPFDDAIESGEHLGPWNECTICDLSAVCFFETCHNDGHWVEVDFPDAADQADCRDQCIASGVATAFQYNDGGWCGCMILDGVTFDEAMASEQHLGPWTECTICDISNAGSLAGGSTYTNTDGYCRGGPAWEAPHDGAGSLWDCSPTGGMVRATPSSFFAARSISHTGWPRARRTGSTLTA